MKRFNIYRSRKARSHLMVAAARNKADALRVARQMFILGRDAFAQEESPMERTWNA